MGVNYIYAAPGTIGQGATVTSRGLCTQQVSYLNNHLNWALPLAAWLKGQEGEEAEALAPFLATAICSSTRLPNAKGKAILSAQRAKYIHPGSGAAPCKAHGAILNDNYFPKVVFFSSPHYKDTTLCLHNKAKAAEFIHEQALSLSDL